MLTNKNTLDFQKNGAKSIKCPTSSTSEKPETQVLVQHLEKPQALQTSAQMKTNGKARPVEFKL